MAKKGEATEKEFELIDMPLDRIHPSEDNPRKEFDEKKLQDLADSMAELGLLNEISVRKDDEGFELVDGERRWRSAHLNEWKTIRSKVYGITPLEALLIRMTVLLSSADVTEREKENSAYQCYLQGLEAGLWGPNPQTPKDTEFPGIYQMAKMLGVNHGLLFRYLSAAQERLVLKNKSAIQQATTNQLNITKNLPEDLREFILEYVIKTEATQKTLTEMTKALEETSEDLQQTALEYAITTEKPGKVLTAMAKAMKDAPSDLRTVVAEGKIEPARAMRIAELSPEQREKYVKEAIAIKLDEDSIERHFEVEITKAIEAEARGVEPPKTSREIQEENSKVEYDNWLRDRYYGIHLDVLAAVKTTNIRKVHDDAKRAQCLGYLQDTIRICDEVLTESRRYAGRKEVTQYA